MRLKNACFSWAKCVTKFEFWHKMTELNSVTLSMLQSVAICYSLLQCLLNVAVSVFVLFCIKWCLDFNLIHWWFHDALVWSWIQQHCKYDNLLVKFNCIQQFDESLKDQFVKNLIQKFSMLYIVMCRIKLIWTRYENFEKWIR